VSSDSQILVGDVGGTHARFAMVEPALGGPWRVLDRLDLAERFTTFSDALRSYLERAGVTALPPCAAIAVAGPVEAGTARFTNRGWVISEQALRDVGFEQAVLINDFAALALAVGLLEKRDLRSIGPQLTGLAGGTITILGAGTGFGVSCLARSGDLVVPMATEGGHMSFAPSDAEELAALELMWKHGGRVSVERILSGDGLERLYRTLQQLAGRTPADLTAGEISAAALRNEAGPRAALSMFCAVFGAVAGDLALAHGARGGVYIAGGIGAKIEEFLQQSPFRRRFEDKGRLRPYVEAIPTQLIVNPDIALLGAARAGRLRADDAI
jgi:glucokinase